MATEQEKNKNLLKISSLVIHGLTKGLWDFIGEASFSTAQLIGDTAIKMLEKDMGLEINGEKPENILMELNRIFLDEIGALTEADAEVEDKKIILTFKGCLFSEMTKDIMDSGIPPFICPFMGMSMAAMRKRGIKARVTDYNIDTDKKVCVHVFEML